MGFRGKGSVWTLSELALREQAVRSTTCFRKGRGSEGNASLPRAKKAKAAKSAKENINSSGMAKPGWKKNPGPVPMGGLPVLPVSVNRTLANRPVRMARLEKELGQGGCAF